MINKNWAILMSGWGRSVIKTLELYRADLLDGHNLNLIVYETPDNGVVDHAEQAGIHTIFLPKGEFETEEAYYIELIRQLGKFKVDYIFLMGYKHIIRGPLLSKYQNRIVNIHPSLLPSFRGKRAIQQALNYGVKITGITTHLIDEELDRGKIICQRCIPVRNGESFDDLDQRFVEEGKEIIKETFTEILNHG